ncbi:hypothetical protein NIIDNTM18_06510 [Mycolicibacterium litorale]|uniref:FAD-binding domain-containing protein n=1 Tax=Mycolicibacterium litorale TaxID=758802 RepID=A0A6S6NW85_9MYCO|nr:hypothetical protein [Mycolicibacterium litorale]BCI51373.1 hypothetical protein NIIDNTM18_06510 [Mycolicibacterium litorale]
MHQYPSNRWRRYDKMARLPEGFVVIGDAVCSFNPVYGQGMTVAAIEATILGQCLRAGDVDLPRRFFRAAAKPVRVAWQTAVGSDLALPEVQGRPSLSMRLTNAYTEHVLRAAGIAAAPGVRHTRRAGAAARTGIRHRDTGSHGSSAVSRRTSSA